MPERELVIVYFDYLCPFAWRASELAEMIAEPLGLVFEWRHFSLYQNNYCGGDGWQLWNDRLDEQSENGNKGLLPFLASCAARKQGKPLHNAFRHALLRARHRDHRPYGRDTVLEVAYSAGLELPRFLSDLADPEARTVLAHEHYRAKALDIFGTPTFQFASGHIAYFRFTLLPRTPEEGVRLFSDYRRFLESYPYVETVKRPRVQGN